MSEYTLRSYETPHLKIPKPPIPKSMMNDAVRRKLEPFMEYTASSNPNRTVQENDYILVTIENAVMDGNPAEMFNGKDKLYKLGTGDMPKSFDDALIGKKAGEQISAVMGMESALAANGSMSKITMDATVEEILIAKRPKLTDEFVSKNFPPAKNEEEFMEQVRSEFTLEDPMENEQEFMSRVLTELVGRLQQAPASDLVAKYGSSWDARIACALNAFADHLDVNLTEEEVIKLLPARSPEGQRAVYQHFVDAGKTDEAYERARQYYTLNWLHDNATLEYED